MSIVGTGQGNGLVVGSSVCVVTFVATVRECFSVLSVVDFSVLSQGHRNSVVVGAVVGGEVFVSGVVDVAANVVGRVVVCI